MVGCGTEQSDGPDGQQGFSFNPEVAASSEPNTTSEPIAATGAISRLPTLGDLVISEILYDPHNGLEDVYAEWIEVQSLTNDALTLDECYLSDASHLNEKRSQADLSGIELIGGGILLAVRSGEAVHNGGLRADATFSFGLGNGGDTVILGCADTILDRVEFDAGSRFPTGKGRSIQRVDDQWCPGRDIYHAPSEQRGTPGEMNVNCGAPPVDGCWIHDHCANDQRCVADKCEGPSGCISSMDCEDDLICEAGECVMPAPAPETLAPGMVVISEFMYDPIGDLTDRKAEWIELKNTTDEERTLSGCYVADSGSTTQWAPLEGLMIPANGFSLLVRSDTADDNGGLEPDGTFRFNLNNTGDEVRFICNDVTLDSVVYGTSDFSASGASLARSGPIGSTANQVGVNWCVSDTVYFESPTHFGTPGTPNPPCP